MDEVVEWASGRLAALMGLNPGEEATAEEMARYLCSIADRRQLQEYLADLLMDAGSKTVDTFATELIDRRAAAAAAAMTAAAAASQDTTSAKAGKDSAGSAKSGKKSSAAGAPAAKSQPAVTATPTVTLTPKKSSAAAASAGVSQPTAPEGGKSSAASHESVPAASAAGAAMTDDFEDFIERPSMPNFFAASSGAALKLAKPQQQQQQSATTSTKSQQRKNKGKYVNFRDFNKGAGSSELVPGRHFCECLATRHALVNNCLQCGRIVCKQEGMGPCMHCGSLVVTADKQELLKRDSRQTQKFLETLAQDCGLDLSQLNLDEFRRSAFESCSSEAAEALAEANARRRQLVEFDRNSARRTRVIDDEADYFNTNDKWLSKEERDSLRAQEDQLRQKKENAKRDRKITLDIVGRRVVDEVAEAVDVYEEARLAEDRRAAEAAALAAEAARASAADTDGQPQQNKGLAALDNPMLAGMAKRPEFRAAAVLHELPSEATIQNRSPKPRRKDRIQDKELQQMSDDGYCMSMHQPWASLLISGIKMHEGRTWYASHRGRLWIAAAAKEPDKEEIANLEMMYRSMVADELQFPKEYPTGCLLGFVDVVDVLPQEEYRARYPTGESNSPFVFICTNPHELIVRYPMKGQHKIYKLERAMHENAKRCLRPVDVQVVHEMAPAKKD